MIWPFLLLFLPFLLDLSEKIGFLGNHNLNFSFKKKKNISVFLSISTISPCPNISSIGRNPYLHWAKTDFTSLGFSIRRFVFFHSFPMEFWKKWIWKQLYYGKLQMSFDKLVRWCHAQFLSLIKRLVLSYDISFESDFLWRRW